MYIKASTDGVLYGNNPNGDLPAISGVLGTVADGQTLTISGSMFSSKANAKPFLYWTANDGLNPSTLGRQLTWQDVFGGELASDITAPGSTQAVRLDHRYSESGLLSKVDFSPATMGYAYRITRDEFDVNTDYVRRTRYLNETEIVPGEVLTVGQVMRGVTSGATGIIQWIGVIQTFPVILFEPVGGTINDPTPLEFSAYEVMQMFDIADTGFITPLVSVDNNEGLGMLTSFNYKCFRAWTSGGSNNNQYLTLGDADETNRAYCEWTGVDAYVVSQWDHIVYQADLKHTWKNEEFVYKTGSVDIQDGIMNQSVNGQRLWDTRLWRQRTTAYPDPYSVFAQAQVSNGCQPGSYSYYDTLYVDDTWHRVIVSESPTVFGITDAQVQVPSAWTDNEIAVTLRGLAFFTGPLYLYVYNALGNVNSNGYALQ